MTGVRSTAFILAFIIAWTSFGSGARTEERHEGGALHQIDMAAWHAASARNRLAITEVFVKEAMGSDNAAMLSFSGMKKLAGGVVICMNKGTTENGELMDFLAKSSAASMAVICMGLIGIPMK